MYFLEISILLRFQCFCIHQWPSSASSSPWEFELKPVTTLISIPAMWLNKLFFKTGSTEFKGLVASFNDWTRSSSRIRILVLVVRASLKEILVLLVQASLKDILGRTILWVDHNSGSDNRLSGWSTILVRTMHHIPSYVHDLDFLGFILCLEARAGAVVIVTSTLVPESSSIIASITKTKTMRSSIICSSFNYFP